MRFTSIARSGIVLTLFLLSSALLANVTGMIDYLYFYPDSSQRQHLKGWACAYGVPDSIAVHVYAVDQTGAWHFVAQAAANLPADQPVWDVCGAAGAFRFDIALDDYLPQYFGQTLYVFGISPNGGSNDLIGNSGVFSFPDGITVNVRNSPLRIRTLPGLGGSIGSLAWNNKEFVNHSDHGREFQIAAKLNGVGECYNPTEAGAQGDVAGDSPTSSSQVFTYSITTSNHFYTGSYPAYWMRPWEYVQRDSSGRPNYWCTYPSFPEGEPARNTEVVSNHQFYKSVTVGFPTLDNVIKVETEIYIPYATDSLQVESFSGSMDYASFPKNYTYTYDAQHNQGVATPKGVQDWVYHPIILASEDGNYALGVYNRQLNEENNPAGSGHPVGHYGMGPTPEAGINSWGAVFDFGASSTGTTRLFTNYLVVGTLQDVLDSMTQLHNTPTQDLP